MSAKKQNHPPQETKPPLPPPPPPPVQTACHPLPDYGQSDTRSVVHTEVCDLKHGELGRALEHIEQNNADAHDRMEQTNADAHNRIEVQLSKTAEQQEAFMEQMRNSILGNGKLGLERRVAALESICAANKSLFILLLRPLLPIAYGLILAALVLYFKQG